jgi:cyclohexanecarboxylate-CoA ligase
VTAGGPVSQENPGRLMIRGASVCLGTMGRDSGTLRVLAEHDEGWYDTGDLTVPDGRGGYRLVGRASDRIGDPRPADVLNQAERAVVRVSPKL